MNGATEQPQTHSCCLYMPVCQEVHHHQKLPRGSTSTDLGSRNAVQIPGFSMVLTPPASHLPQALSRCRWTTPASLSVPGLSSRSGNGSPARPDLSKDFWKSCHHLTAVQKLQPRHNIILNECHFCLSKGRLMAEWKCLLNVLNGNEWSSPCSDTGEHCSTSGCSGSKESYSLVPVKVTNTHRKKIKWLCPKKAYNRSLEHK